MTWRDIGQKDSQNVCNECPLKVRKFQLPIFSSLTIAHENPEEASEDPPPANNTVNPPLAGGGAYNAPPPSELSQ